MAFLPRLDIQLSLFQTDWGQAPFGGFGGFNFGGAQLAPGEAGKAGDKRWGGENEVSGAERSIYPLWRMDNHGLSFLNLFFLFHFFFAVTFFGHWEYTGILTRSFAGILTPISDTP
jgi:hypothetical protein